ncbi:MAG: TRAP transporter small permease [Hyphomicrobiaceae bacterium]|nr:TRAP transporter small permease [Hyphomicrobiaceae bacterium]
MESLWNGLTRVSRGAIVAGSALLFIAALVVTAEVLIRKAVPDFVLLVSGGGGEAFRVWIRDNLTFSGSDEISGYLFAVGTSWSLAYATVTRGHVRIDAVYGSLSPAVRGWLDLAALLCLALFVGALVERAWDVSMTNFIEYNRSNTNLRVPLAWAQLPWMAGIVLFFLTIAVAIIRTFQLLLRGDYAGVNALAGASSQDEEIESELKGLGIEAPHGGKK